jgi:hypothetical protein
VAGETVRVAVHGGVMAYATTEPAGPVPAEVPS